MISRYINLQNLIEKKHSFFLFGARGTGKTSLLKELNYPIINLLQSRAFRRYLADPSLFSDEIEHTLKNSSPSKKLFIAVDEIQKLPALLDEIHHLIESHKNRLLFILTGSSARKLKRGGANLLAGRAHTYELFPLSSLETEVELNLALQIGTLPGIYTDPTSAIDSLEAYVNTYLREEILEESLVRKIDRFSRFLELAAQLNSEPINYKKLGRALNTSGPTIQDYFSILVDTLIAYRVDGWSRSVKLQLLQSPKFYFFDCGILNALSGELRSEVSPSSPRYGRLFETWMVAEIQRFNSYQRLGLKLFYWRDQNGREIDLILSRKSYDPLVAIEIKSSEAPDTMDLKALELIGEEYPKIPQWCFCRTPRSYKRQGVEFLPWRTGLARLVDL